MVDDSPRGVPGVLEEFLIKDVSSGLCLMDLIILCVVGLVARTLWSHSSTLGLASGLQLGVTCFCDLSVCRLDLATSRLASSLF